MTVLHPSLLGEQIHTAVCNEAVQNDQSPLARAF
jgi:hypothetical protein